jgi:alpha-galactosidase
MTRPKFLLALLVCFSSSATLIHAQVIAPTPPMGWNSWDAYGLTINEDDYKANASVLAEFQRYGWKYAVVDEGWYMADPAGKTVEDKHYVWNANGLLIPAEDRFPSAANGAGFKPVADWVHAHGLKFGIHIVRGIPRQVVKANLPIEGTSFTAADAADTSSPCPWDDGNWGVKDNAAGQAYYDSMIKLYAGWGVDFLKVDCISDHPYRPTEIRQVAQAIQKTGRPILLSLSPGPTSLKNAVEVGKYAQMWRIADDHWDVWSVAHTPGQSEFPFGIKEEFERLAAWVPYVNPGNWADADMLPWGWLGPNPGWGDARQSRETHDEQQTEFTLFAISRSPLILGANLTRLDPFTRSLITNQAMTFMNQSLTYSRTVDAASLPAGFEHARVWRGTVDSPGARNYSEYFAFFNLDDKPVTLKATWKQLGLEGGRHMAQNVWSDNVFKESKEVNVTLPAHGSTVYQVR